jgi:preprotein translocase subunit Sss1
MREAITVITVGIVGWAIYLVFALASNADSKAIYTALVGIILGLIGIRYTIRRGRREKI